MTKARSFFESICGKRVAICGIGNNNVPVIHQFLQAGAQVIACDRRSAQDLGETAQELMASGETPDMDKLFDTNDYFV